MYLVVWMSSGQIHARSSTKAAETVVSLLCRESLRAQARERESRTRIVNGIRFVIERAWYRDRF